MGSDWKKDSEFISDISRYFKVWVEESCGFLLWILF